MIELTRRPSASVVVYVPGVASRTTRFFPSARTASPSLLVACWGSGARSWPKTRMLV
jgi:hypothetical protein